MHIPGAGGIGQGMVFRWGAEAVVVFFVLSGAVIRLSFDRSPRSRGDFVKSRATRLLPLYWCALLLTVLVQFAVGPRPAAWVVGGNALFLQTLQGFVCPVLEANTPLWSLSFEAFFYGVFALTIGRNRKVLVAVWAALAAAAAVSQPVGVAAGPLGQLQMLTAYSSVWLLGYYAVDLVGLVPIGSAGAFAWFGLFPAVARLPRMAGHYTAANDFLIALTVLPLLVLAIRRGRGEWGRQPAWVWAVWLASYVGVVTALVTVGKSLGPSKLLYCLIPWAGLAFGAAAARWGSGASALLTPLALRLGRVSYAVYLFHAPIYYSGGLFGLSGYTAVAVLVPLAVAIACAAEYYIHPALAKVLDSVWGVARRAEGRPAPQVDPGTVRPTNSLGT